MALVLGLLGSFGFLAIAGIGCFFITAALATSAARPPGGRASATASLIGFALVVFGLVMTPLVYLGVACVGMGVIASAAGASVVHRRKLPSTKLPY